MHNLTRIEQSYLNIYTQLENDAQYEVLHGSHPKAAEHAKDRVERFFAVLPPVVRALVESEGKSHV